jgi:hypothetical protein
MSGVPQDRLLRQEADGRVSLSPWGQALLPQDWQVQAAARSVVILESSEQGAWITELVEKYSPYLAFGTLAVATVVYGRTVLGATAQMRALLIAEQEQVREETGAAPPPTPDEPPPPPRTAPTFLAGDPSLQEHVNSAI